MLGFFCATAGVLTTVPAAIDANRPSQMLLAILMDISCNGLPERRAGSLHPNANRAEPSRDDVKTGTTAAVMNAAGRFILELAQIRSRAPRVCNNRGCRGLGQAGTVSWQ